MHFAKTAAGRGRLSWIQKKQGKSALRCETGLLNLGTPGEARPQATLQCLPTRRPNLRRIHSRASWSRCTQFSDRPSAKAWRCLPAIHGTPLRMLAETFVPQRQTTAPSQELDSSTIRDPIETNSGFHSWKIGALADWQLISTLIRMPVPRGTERVA